MCFSQLTSKITKQFVKGNVQLANGSRHWKPLLHLQQLTHFFLY